MLAILGSDDALVPQAMREDLRRLYGAAVAAGAKRVCIADTVGHATPNGARNVVRFIRGVVGDAIVSSLVLLPTPGHTHGSMSMLVRRRETVPLLLVGDLTYDIHAFERGRTGGVGSRNQLRKTRDKVLELRANNPGLQILAAHDPAAAGLLDAVA